MQSWRGCSCAAAAKFLKAHEEELQGTVKLLFQPAEEGGAGAKLMLDQGALQGVSAVFGLHVWPTAPSGHILTRVGLAHLPKKGKLSDAITDPLPLLQLFVHARRAYELLLLTCLMLYRDAVV